MIFLLSILLFSGSVKNCNAENIHNRRSVLRGLSRNERESPVTFLRLFFKWYKTKFDYLDHQIHPVDVGIHDNSPYKINFKETEKYLATLRSSGFFSDNYINRYRDHFNKIELTLKKTKQNDGPVDGLDFDPIVHSQEPEAILEDLNKIQLSILKSEGNKVTVKVKTQFDVDTNSLYYITKNGDKYQIDKIDFLINGVIQK